jgi:hypothetical protein
MREPPASSCLHCRPMGNGSTREDTTVPYGHGSCATTRCTRPQRRISLMVAVLTATQASLALTETDRFRPADPDLRTPAQPLLSMSPDGRFIFCTGATTCDVEQRDTHTGQVHMRAGCCVLPLISADCARVHLPGCARAAAPDPSPLLERAPERSGRFARLASGLCGLPKHRGGV